MKPVARWSAVAALGLVVGGASSATAADLGGNCCADLEERIAELEATTARKGNRKVSLTISGWVNEAVFLWDDGIERNAYVGTNALEQSRFKFAGEAKIDGDWSAGYTLEVGLLGGDSKGFSASDEGWSNSLSVRKSSWFLKSKSLGKISVGQEGTATYHLLDDADGTLTRNYSDAEAAAVAMGSFVTVVDGARTGLKWTDLMRGFNNNTPGQDRRQNIVRYDTPAFMNFVVSAAWGADDLWDVALTYKNTLGDFDLTGKVGYGHANDEFSPNKLQCSGAVPSDCDWWGVGGTIKHNPTGLFAYAAYGEQKDDARSLVDPNADENDTMYIVQLGVEQKFNSLGKTNIFGEYRHDDAGSNVSATSVKTQGADLDFWAAGVVQNIEAAAMDLYVIYRHAEGDFVDGAGVKNNLDDFDLVITGARIQF